jgi:hypothetical protein
MDKLTNKNIVVAFFLLLIIGCNESNITRNNSTEIHNEEDLEKKNNESNCLFVFQGTYSDWIATRNDLYFPLTSLDTTINKQKEYYDDHYLIIRNNWLILVEVGRFSDILNEFPLIPLLKHADKKEIKKNLTHIFLPIQKLVIIDDHEELSEKGDYRVYIEIYCRDEGTSCKYIIDISYLKGKFYFKTDCNNTKILP